MNFRKKTIGNILNMSHVWIAKRNGNELIIRFDENRGQFWFQAVKNDEVLFDSSSEGTYFGTVEEAESFVEGWVQEKLFGRVKKKAKLSMEKRYRLLVDVVRRFIDNNPSHPGVDELSSALRKINEV